VITNLLTNAIKFTAEDGHVHVRVQRAGPMTTIEVTDSGKGISSDALPFVFERFWQGDTSATRAEKGVGLGLSIAKDLVVAHGGSIDASSEGDGKGATFTVRLPLAESPLTRQSDAPPQQV
jgi:signal transduction histidine kinase